MELGQAIHTAAEQLGIDPLDLATVISYETGGTFSPSIVGGKNNAHVGLIQFGGPEREMYGAHAGQGAAEQMGAVVRYLSDRGVTPGMGLLDLYSTVNAGSPGRYSASDGPGNTVSGHVAKMEPHRAKAAKMLSLVGSNVAPKGDFNPEGIGAPPQPDIADVHTALKMREMAGAETIADSDLGGLLQALQPMVEQFNGLEARGKMRRLDAGKPAGPEPQFSPPFNPHDPDGSSAMEAGLRPKEPVVAEPVERTELGALLQHISGGLQPPPSPAPRPGSRLRS